MRILHVIDTFDWAFHRTANALVKHVNAEHMIATLPDKSNCDWADTIHVVSAMLASHAPAEHWHKVVVGFCSMPEARDAMRLLPAKPRAAYGINDSMVELLAPLGAVRMRKLVDTNLFRPVGPFPPELTIGFCGNKNSPNKMFYLVESVCTATGAEFRGAGFGFPDRLYTEGDLSKFYSGLSCLMICSMEEGTPAVLLEAMACGTPVIASPVGHVEEIVTHGEDGFICHSVHDFIDAAVLCHRDRKRLGVAARQKALDNDWLTVADEWERLLVT